MQYKLKLLGEFSMETSVNLTYKKIFDPNNKVTFTSSNVKNIGDRCSKSVYVYNDKIVLAVNVAIATGRPLLVRGPSGWGKSSLAKSVADILDWRYCEKVISSRMQARDLLWEVDLIRRLQDAQKGTLNKDFAYYVKPGVLWWAFNLESAQIQENKFLSLMASTPKEQDSASDTPKEQDSVSDTPKEQDSNKNKRPEAVVLLDEIDKADPDLPNNLLVPLGSLCFTVEETNTKVKCEVPPLVIITTNDERELPPAFLRRCVELDLKHLKPDLIEVGKAHFDLRYMDLVEKVAGLFKSADPEEDMERLSKQSYSSNPKELPSPAEFIDTVSACIKLNITPESEIWDLLIKTTVWKHGRK